MALDKFSFNRYIVECKCKYPYNKLYHRLCFNRYIVECKFDKAYKAEFAAYSFNRYIVECKSLKHLQLTGEITVLIDT